MIESKDIVSPLMGASGSVAGLTLVFLGIVLTARQAYEADTPSNVLKKYRAEAVTILIAFLFGLGTVVTGAVWLVTRGTVPGTFTTFLVVGALQVVGLVTAAVRVVRRVW